MLHDKIVGITFRNITKLALLVLLVIVLSHLFPPSPYSSTSILESDGPSCPCPSPSPSPCPCCWSPPSSSLGLLMGGASLEALACCLRTSALAFTQAKNALTMSPLICSEERKANQIKAQAVSPCIRAYEAYICLDTHMKIPTLYNATTSTQVCIQWE